MIEDNKFNVSCDLGHLLVYDNQPFKKEFVNEDDMLERGKSNLKHFFGELFKLANSQKGQNEETRDFDKPEDNVALPKPVTLMPRAKPIPRPKALTKWERFRTEKGMPTTMKRSRMVYSELAKDWVPRWGKGSVKQIDEKAEWALEETPDMEGKDPFAIRSQQKKLMRLKQEKNENKNTENRIKDKKAKDGKKLEKVSLDKPRDEKFEKKGKSNKKFDKNESNKARLNAEKKGLDKTLETVQQSTASYGKFDRKVKHEKEINPIKQKRNDPKQFLSRKQERDRNSKILDSIIGKKK